MIQLGRKSMIYLGHIRIKNNKVYFEPDNLKRPNKDDYWNNYMTYFYNDSYYEALRKYEASKQTIEVENILNVAEVYKKDDWRVFIDNPNKILKDIYSIKNNQSCEAEAENNIATIIKIT